MMHRGLALGLLVVMLVGGCTADVSPLSADLRAPPVEGADLLVDEPDLAAPDLAFDPCGDGILEPGETDVDCGGPNCKPCVGGRTCERNRDCTSGRCLGQICWNDPCQNGRRDGGETDVDCGGPACPHCPAGLACDHDEDCKAGLCTHGTCAPAAAKILSFAEPLSYPVGGDPRDVAVADFNSDRRADLVVANNGSNDVSVFLGRGDGTFPAAHPWPVGEHALAMVIGDFNGDKRPDIAVTGNYILGAAIILGLGGGVFSSEVKTAVMSPNLSIWGFGAGDLDGDGKDDIVIGNHGPQLPVLLANGMGTFHVDLTTSSPKCDGIAVVDVDHDRQPDVLAFLTDLTGMSMLKGDAKGGLAMPVLSPARNGCAVGAVWDLDRDGHLDAVDCQGNLYYGKGDGSFDTLTGSPFNGGKPAVADFDRDGVFDIVVAGGSTVEVYRGSGKRAFGAPLVAARLPAFFQVAVGDFNGDELPDIAVIEHNGGVSVLLNTSK